MDDADVLPIALEIHGVQNRKKIVLEIVLATTVNNRNVVIDAHMLDKLEKEHLIIAALDQQQASSVLINLDILHPRTS